MERSDTVEQGRSFGRALLWILIVLLIILAALLFLVFTTLHSGPPWIAEEQPLEDRRVVHPQGFSIVKPPGWFAQIERASDHWVDQIQLRANEKPMRAYTGITVTLFPENPLSFERGHPHYVSNYHETDFGGMRAYEKTILRAGKRDYFTHYILVTNHSRWYLITYQIPADVEKPSITNVPKTMMPYIQSFRPIP